MRGFLMVLGVLLGFAIQAQSLDIVELGHIAGEMRQFKGTLSWATPHTDTLTVQLWSARTDIEFETKKLKVLPGQSTSFGYSLAVDSLKGLQQYEVRLLGAEDIVLHGWLLKARVFEAEEDVFRAYRNEFFPFRMQEQVMNLHAAFRGDTLTKQFNLYNFGGEELDLSAAYSQYPGLSINFEPVIVPHNRFTRATVTLATNTDTEIGFTRNLLTIYTADSSILATVPLQYTLESRPTGNRGATPHLALSKLSHDFKVLEPGDLESVQITLTNTGSDRLVIEKLEANCDCLSYELDQNELEKGESVQLKVSYNAKGRMGYERKTLALFTNDPDQPTRVLTFKAHVK